MKTKIILLICVWMTGCGESKVAEEYARKMTTVLSTYRTQVDKNIRAEQQSYVDLAKTYDTSIHFVATYTRISRQTTY